MRSGRRTTPVARRLAAGLAALSALAVVASGCGLAPNASDAAGDKPSPAWQQSGAPTSKPTGPAIPGDDPAGMPSEVAEGLRPFYEQRLQWRDCGAVSGQQCTTLEVPLDYDQPSKKTIELAVLRVRAKGKDKSKRIGSLVLNPGGPGGSGVEYAQASSMFIGAKVRERYDIVGFDPRGVGQSSPVDCLTDSQLDTYLAADGSPDTPAEVQRLSTLSKQFAEGCAERSGDLLEHVGTPDAARDMDVLRSALGDQELYYFGASYGTYLGATYAELFPKRVGRAVLDGAVPPELTGKQLGVGQAKGFERAFKAFVDDCISRGGCPLGDTESAAYDRFDELLDDLDKTPLPGDGPRKLTQALGVSGILGSLYRKDSWAGLRTGLSAALNGDGSYLLSYADTYAQRTRDGYHGNGNEAILAVNCLDRPDVRSVADAEKELPAYEKASPRFGKFILWGSLACAYWPVEVQNQPHKVSAPGAPPILVVGTSRDPATIFEWSHDLASQLSSGVLLTRDGDGHTAYGDNDCIDSAIDTYLVDGTTPKDGLNCPNE